MGYHRILATTTVKQLEDLTLDVHDLDKACVDNGIKTKLLSTPEKVTKLWNLVLQKKKEQGAKPPKIADDDYDRRFDALNKKAVEKLEHARLARLIAHLEADEVLEAWEEKILEELDNSIKQLRITRKNQEKANAESKKAWAQVEKVAKANPKAQNQKQQATKDAMPARDYELSYRSRKRATPEMANNVKGYLRDIGARGVADVWATRNTIVVRFETSEDAIEGSKWLEGYGADIFSLIDDDDGWVASKVKAAKENEDKKNEKQAARSALKRTVSATESDEDAAARPTKESKPNA